MGKKIVLCADGTWETPESNTNVYKIFQAIVQKEDQVVFYDTGVGTEGPSLEKWIDGVLGSGLFEKIKDGYRNIAEIYKEGDEIFLFGFSRGA